MAIIAATSAFADEGSQSSEGPFSQPDYGRIPSNAPPLAPTTNPEAAEELPHTELDRSQALQLERSVFGAELQGPAGMFDELEVEKFYSDHVAVIAAGDQPEAGGGEGSAQPTLLESLLPLRAENTAGEKEVVDLDLEHAEGELQPANPLTEVGIPSELGEGISLPEAGVEIFRNPMCGRRLKRTKLVRGLNSEPTH